MRHVLAVDGGATKTHALIADETGLVRGFGSGGPSNHQTVGMGPAIDEIGRAAGTALAEAGLAPETIETGRFCLAGADLPEDYAKLQRAVERLALCRAVVISNDTLAALRAGATRPWAVVVICGTGFNAAGRAPDGREIILPGLGAISGDWGGGADLGQEVIRLVMRAWDGRGQPTRLSRLVLDALETDSESALLSRLYHGAIDRSRINDLAPLLFEAADGGDTVARELVARMGEEVGVTANALIHRLGLESTDVEVVLGGSVFKGQGTLLIDVATMIVRREAPRARIVALRHPPVYGAALLALESIGIQVTLEVHERLSASILV
jgi:N-acetylglucosamine kinase-like BadF-type ATPase